ncbi:MAG: phosphatase PAP2 family protein [Gemmataceae bacterium]
MADPDVMAPRPLAAGIFFHEWCLLALGTGTLGALLARAGPHAPVAWETAAATAGYGVLVLGLRGRNPLARRLSYLMAYGYILWFYLAVVRITPALGTTPRDRALCALDRAILGETPAVLWQNYTRPWLTDLFSAAYLGYLAYLHVALGCAFVAPIASLHRLAAPLFGAFAAGLLGYLLVPALGPAVAHPDAFAAPLTGGALTWINDLVVSHGSSRYDVFPSLHVLITCVLLDHDYRAAPRRFLLMLLPAGLLFASTLYLRYHYAIDLAAAFALFLTLCGLRRLLHKPAARASGAAAPASIRAEDHGLAATSGACRT